MMTVLIVLYVLLLLVGSSTGSLFYPYGTGDTQNERSDDGSSPNITLLQPFIYFGETLNKVYVNNNGYLMFDGSWSSYSPYAFPAHSGTDIIAPFWTDIDNRDNGVISYQQYTSGSVLTQATQDINQYFPDLSFSASWVFVATWDRVAYFPLSGTETSFQVVLISDGHLSFVIMNYGTIAPTEFVQAGYDTMDSSHHFSITGSLETNLTDLPNRSNVNVSGRWAFRTDHGSRGCRFNGLAVQLGDSFWSDSTCQEKCICTIRGVQCSPEPCSYSQACRRDAFQFSCQNIQRQTCTVSGDPHYYTFDNQIFHFQGTCTYVLSEACGYGLPYYRVEGKNENRHSTLVSWTQTVRVFVYDVVIELKKDNNYEAKVNGTFRATPFTLNNGSIHVYQSGFTLTISTNFGLVVTYDAYSWVRISVPYEYQNATCGLCGNFNLNPEDDFRSPSGEILSSDVEFANSWTVEEDTDPECNNEKSANMPVCRPDVVSVYSGTNYCGILGDESGPFAACHSVLSPQTYIESCVFDICVGGGYQPILCQALNVYAAQCQLLGAQLGQWRRQGYCEIQCRENSHFESQGTSCPATCSDPLAPVNCPLPNTESCICDAGYILSAGTCVPEAECGCTFEGFYYDEAQSVVLDEGCGRQCVCRNRTMICYEHQCGPAEVCEIHHGVRGCRPTSYATCSVESLGFYHTFDGLRFRYPGACELTLARVMSLSLQPYFAVTVEKVPRGLNNFTRFLKFESEGTQVSIEIGEVSIVQVNGRKLGMPIREDCSQISIYQSNVMGVVLETNFGVSIRANWPYMIQITVPVTYSDTLEGLCGNLNGNITDEFINPDGILLEDSHTFADSWRDGSLSAHCEEPADLWQTGHYQNSQFSEQCSIMTMSDGPFAECSRTIDPTQRIQDCIQMLEQTSGAREALCEALRGYTLLCQQNSIAVGEWRNVTQCEPICPPNSHYQLCGTSCPASCPSLSFPFQCSLQCQEGCQCDDGLVLNGDHCVPPMGCGCRYAGHYRQPGEHFWHDEECQSLCVCDGVTGFVHCRASSCSEQEVCSVVNGEYGCHPSPHASCSASGDPLFISFDGTYFDLQGTCRYVLATVCNDTRGLPHFQVDARNLAMNELPVSITAEVFVNISGHFINISQDMDGYYSVEIDGETRNLPAQLESGLVTVSFIGQQVLVSTDFGLSVTYGYWAVNIIVPEDYKGITCGLCGNFNGQTEDDFMTPSGSLAPSADQFGAAWKVENDIPCSNAFGDNSPMCQNQTTANAMCEIIRDNQGPFSFCHASVDPEVYFNACLLGVCLSGNCKDVLCHSIQSYVRACQSANAVIYPWRESTYCDMMCPENSHYELCGTDCDRTCTRAINTSCEHTCTEGCFCDDGFVRCGELCVAVDECGCSYNGFYFDIGEKFWDSECSQHCECLGPSDMFCSTSSCPPTMQCTIRNGHRGCYSEMSTCMVWGDPHYLTFDGALVDFQGLCSYEIAQTCNVASDDLGFRVVATNRHRGNTAVSFVSVVDVWLSQHGKHLQITIEQNRKLKVNGIYTDLPALQINDLVEVHEEKGFVVLNALNKIIVLFDGDSILLIQLSQSFSGSVSGMCGNFNGDPVDDKELPCGGLAPDDTVFGNSWKSNISTPGCGDSNQTANPEDCPFKQEYSDLCRIIINTTGPFQECHHHVDPEIYFNSCVYDLCLYTPENGMLHAAVRAYETACVILGIHIPEWRSSLQCYVTDPCAELNCTEEEWCGEKDGVHGCFCNDNHPRPNPDSFDFSEACESSSGSLSLSRCQLFEAGFPADVLHLNDPSCRGTIQNGRVLFHFDKKDQICGTSLLANGTHVIYENYILGVSRSTQGPIRRDIDLQLSFSCIYSLRQTVTMEKEIHPLESVVHRTLPSGEGRYQVRVVPYQDSQFSRPFTGDVDVQINKEIFVEVAIDGVDSHRYATVIDTCWATPVNDPDYSQRWDLITGECPSTYDRSVKLLQNGVSTSSRFSFRTFNFDSNFTKVYLHCSVHLCFKESSNCTAHCYPGCRQRVGRSLDFHDTASISMGPLVLSDMNSDERSADIWVISGSPTHCQSILLLISFLTICSIL